MKRIHLVTYLLLLFSLLLLNSCRFSQPRVSLRLGASESQIQLGESVNLNATLSIPEGLIAPANPVFRWTATGGTLSSDTGPSVDFQANESGIYRITVEVDDESLSSRTNLLVYEDSFLNSSSEPVLLERKLSEDQQDIYRIDVTEKENDLLFFDLRTQDDVTLELLDDEGDLIARSRRSTDFSYSAFKSLSIESQAIETFSSCRGPCVSIVHDKAEYFVRIVANERSTYDLFAFAAPYGDTTEPLNNACVDAPSELNVQTITVTPKYSFLGAIETLNDEDCFETGDNVSFVQIETFSETSIRIQAKVYTLENRLLYTLNAGDGQDLDSLTITTAIPVRVRVSAKDENAAPAFNSRYKLIF